jgi:acetylornithine deacetylase/succinyl-diaminopimelate desuccinylase-like protein
MEIFRSRKMRLLILPAAMLLALSAAEPDWPAIEKDAIGLLQRYIRVQSVNPPADTREAAKLIQGELLKHGIESKLYPAGPDGQTNLVARLKGRNSSKKPLLLLNHFDVVPVDPKAWKMDPFGAEIKDGYIWGRGALDMKGIGVQHLMAMIAMKQAGIVPPRDIAVLITSDEESSGTYGIRYMIDKHFEEFAPEYVLDEGGFGTRDILSPGKLVFGVMVGEKNVLWLRLKATGIAGHGSQPIADNSNLMLLRAVEKALNVPASPKPHETVAEMEKTIGTVATNKYTSAIRGNTISVTSLTSGVGNPPKVTVIPSNAEATLDCRLLPGVNPDEFASEIRARINDPRVALEVIFQGKDSGVSDHHTPLFEAMTAAVLKHHPGAVVTPMLVPHATDSKYLRMKGVIAYGFTPMVLDLATSATMHSDAERIPVAEFLKGIRIVFDVLRSDF